jgi:hypothetical protein
MLLCNALSTADSFGISPIPFSPRGSARWAIEVQINGDSAENTREKNFHERNGEGAGSNLEGKIGAPYMAKTLQNFNVKSLDLFFVIRAI